MEHSTDLLEERAVKAFGGAVVLGGVMDSEATDCAATRQVLSELVAEILSTTIGVKLLDSKTELGEEPSFELEVAFEGVRFVADKVNNSEAAVVVREADKVFLPVDCFDRCWTPQVRVNLLAHCASPFPFPNLLNGLPMPLSPITRGAKRRFAALVELHPCHQSLLHQSPCGVMPDMSQTPVQLVDR